MAAHCSGEHLLPSGSYYGGGKEIKKNIRATERRKRGNKDEPNGQRHIHSKNLPPSLPPSFTPYLVIHTGRFGPFDYLVGAVMTVGGQGVVDLRQGGREGGREGGKEDGYKKR